MKGKDMILSDFLSRQDIDDSNLHEIIPISFNLRTVLQDKYYNLENGKEKYMIQTRSQTKASGVKLPEVHGVRKRLDPHKILEKQHWPIVNLIAEKKPRLSQGRVRIKRKVKLALPSVTQGKREDIICLKVPSSKPITGNGEAAQAVDSVVPVLINQKFLEKSCPHIFYQDLGPLQNPLIS